MSDDRIFHPIIGEMFPIALTTAELNVVLDALSGNLNRLLGAYGDLAASERPSFIQEQIDITTKLHTSLSLKVTS